MMLVDRQPQIVIISAVLIGLSTLSTALRFLARHISGTGLWWDDWCSVVALILSYSLNVVQFVGVHCGLGRHTEDVGIEGITCFLKSLYSVEPFYAFTMPFIKFTMVLFYWRIFGTNPGMRKALLVITAILVAWNIGALFSAIFQCSPIDKFWNVETPGKCFNGLVYFRAIACTNLLTDVLILIVPMPVIWGLKISHAQKIALSGVFLLGGFVSVVSIVRITTLSKPSNPDPLFVATPGTIWTAVETSVGVVSINLPVMYPLIRRILPRSMVSSGRNTYPSGKNSKYGPGAKHNNALSNIRSYTGTSGRHDRAGDSLHGVQRLGSQQSEEEILAHQRQEVDSEGKIWVTKDLYLHDEEDGMEMKDMRRAAAQVNGHGPGYSASAMAGSHAI